MRAMIAQRIIGCIVLPFFPLVLMLDYYDCWRLELKWNFYNAVESVWHDWRAIFWD